MLLTIFSGYIFSLLAPFMYRIFRDRTGWIASAFAFLLASFFLRFTDSVTSGEVIRYYHHWFPSLGIGFSFIVDGLSLTFSLLITIIGGFVFAYSSGYMKGIKNTGRFYLYILMFMTSMLGVVNSDNLVTLFVFWELTSITSYLLIGFKNENKIARAAALQALLVTVAGGLALLAGIVLIGFAGGSYEFTELLKKRGNCKKQHDVPAGACAVPGRSIYKICTVSFPFLATGCYGGSHTCQCISAFCHDGDRRCFSACKDESCTG